MGQPPMNEEKRVLIVGAGPTGLMLAIELARMGVVPRVIDTLQQPTKHSRALAIFARTLELFDRADVARPMIARGRKLRGGSFHAEGRRIASFSMVELDTRFNFVLSLPQTDTEAILQQRAESLGVQIDRGTELVSLDAENAEANEPVTVTLCNNDSGQSQEQTYDWVIGCDGAHSTVREALGLRFIGPDLPDRFVFADAKVKWPLPDTRVHVFFSPEGVVAGIPLPKENYWRLVADLPQNDDPIEQPSLDLVASLARSRSGIDVTCSDPQWVSGITVRQRKVKKFRVGRVFLAGDAAHTHSPVAGQGMNTGLQDAANLAWKLAFVINNRAPDSLLDTYSREREPIAKLLLRGTEAATRIVTLQQRLPQIIRNHMLQVLTGYEVVQERIARDLSELVLHYRKSSISKEYHSSVLQATLRSMLTEVEQPNIDQWMRFSHGPHAGDRAPDEELQYSSGQELHVFDLLKTGRLTLLLFDGYAQTTAGYDNLTDIAAAIEQQYGELIDIHIIIAGGHMPAELAWTTSILLDPDHDLHQRYAADSECIYLIRPDGYVGFRCQPASLQRLQEYLADTLQITSS